tara:strand:- start:789 stop:992 length:204 start_codon:yes stop_codon:yes gene_type:complete
MIWLLLVIQLGGDPISGNSPIILRGEVAETFASKQACEEKIKKIAESKEQRHPTIRLGCVIYPKKAI